MVFGSRITHLDFARGDVILLGVAFHKVSSAHENCSFWYDASSVASPALESCKARNAT